MESTRRESGLYECVAGKATGMCRILLSSSRHDFMPPLHRNIEMHNEASGGMVTKLKIRRR